MFFAELVDRMKDSLLLEGKHAGPRAEYYIGKALKRECLAARVKLVHDRHNGARVVLSPAGFRHFQNFDTLQLLDHRGRKFERLTISQLQQETRTVQQILGELLLVIRASSEKFKDVSTIEALPVVVSEVVGRVRALGEEGIFVYDTQEWTMLHRIGDSGAGLMASSSLSPDGSHIAVANLVNGFDIYDLEAGSLVLSLFHKVGKQYMVPVLYVHGGNAILGGSTVGYLDLWYVEGTLSRKMQTLSVPGAGRVSSVTAHYNGESDQFFITAGVINADSESLVTLWKADEGRSKVSASGRAASRGPSGNVPPPTDKAEYWTRFGVQNGKPVFVREHRISSTKDKDCITYWWACVSRSSLAEPPKLGDRSDLVIGDLFCNHIMGMKHPQMWICTAVGNGQPTWSPIAAGDTCEDGRRLYVTPKKKQLSWVTAQWCLKQMLKQERAGEFAIPP
ncbi:hypothetical protein ACG7TL_006135 [Trametes sanguinea]